MKEAVIFDLDDVLFDSTALKQYIPIDKTCREQWRLFETHYNEVIPNEWAAELVNFYRSIGRTILFVTSREDIDNCKGTTIQSISKALNDDLSNVWLFMRKANDYRESHEVKREIYENEIKDNWDVKIAVDDDPMNCQMFHSLGIHTLQKIVSQEEVHD